MANVVAFFHCLVAGEMDNNNGNTELQILLQVGTKMEIQYEMDEFFIINYICCW